MNPNSRLRHETGAELAAEQTVAATQATARDFATPEELLRFERQQTPPPAALATRLETSLSVQPTPVAQPWWKRWVK